MRSSPPGRCAAQEEMRFRTVLVRGVAQGSSLGDRVAGGQGQVEAGSLPDSQCSTSDILG